MRLICKSDKADLERIIANLQLTNDKIVGARRFFSPFWYKNRDLIMSSSSEPVYANFDTSTREHFFITVAVEVEDGIRVKIYLILRTQDTSSYLIAKLLPSMTIGRSLLVSEHGSAKSSALPKLSASLFNFEHD